MEKFIKKIKKRIKNFRIIFNNFGTILMEFK